MQVNDDEKVTWKDVTVVVISLALVAAIPVGLALAYYYDESVYALVSVVALIILMAG